MKKQTIIIIVLVILLIASVGYIGVDYWQDKKQAELDSAYQLGSSNTMKSLFQLTEDCGAPIMTFENFTRQIIDVECME